MSSARKPVTSCVGGALLHGFAAQAVWMAIYSHQTANEGPKAHYNYAADGIYMMLGLIIAAPLGFAVGLPITLLAVRRFPVIAVIASYIGYGITAAI